MGHVRTSVIGIVMVALVLGGCAAQGAAAATEPAGARRTITGTATGKVEGVPDTLTLTLGVETSASSAQEALAQNADRSTRLLDALKAAGVAPKDIKTAQLTVNPTYDKSFHVNGYSVSNVVTAKVDDVLNAGKVVDAAAAQAGNAIRLQGIALSIADTGKLVAAARTEAVRHARAQAAQLARAAGVRLGKVERITERKQGAAGGLANRAVAEDSAGLSVPIEPGTQELSVDVTVVYRIK
jgi:hypothetical protein